MPGLTEQIVIRVSDRVVLRATPEITGKDLHLVEMDGTRISAASPVAILLDRPDLIDALSESGAEMVVFRGVTVRFRLVLKKEIGGLRLLILTPDEQERDAHETPIAAILPRTAPIRLVGMTSTSRMTASHGS